MGDKTVVPRYSKRAFPPYRFVPGRAPHPRRDPKGHAYGTPEPKPEPVPPEKWRECETYLYGIDLFNAGYWWECHEELEALWHAVGHETPQGQFLQGIIQVAAAHLQLFMGSEKTAQGLAEKGLARLKDLPPTYMGVAVREFERDVSGKWPVLIRLS